MSPSATPSISKITASRRPPFSAKLKAISMEISLSSVAEKLSLTLSVFLSQTPSRLAFLPLPYLFFFFSSVTAFLFLPDLPLQPTLQQQPPSSSRPSLSTTLQPSKSTPPTARQPLQVSTLDCSSKPLFWSYID